MTDSVWLQVSWCLHIGIEAGRAWKSRGSEVVTIGHPARKRKASSIGRRKTIPVVNQILGVLSVSARPGLQDRVDRLARRHAVVHASRARDNGAVQGLELHPMPSNQVMVQG